MRYVYMALSICIIALGAIHIAATPRLFVHLTSGAIWFASAGLLTMMTGALNLLRREYGESATGVRLVCVLCNIVMTIFSLLAGYATRASAVGYILVLGLIGGATLFSLVPAAQKRTQMNHYS
jgi:hypothetical protein